LNEENVRQFLHHKTDSFSSGRHPFLIPLLAEVVAKPPLPGHSKHFLIGSLSQGNRTLELISAITAEDFAGGNIVCAMFSR
jgi:hypothetical protein